MKKMNKILGAAAIVGLFLLSAIGSTSLAALSEEKPVLSEEELEYQMLVDYLKGEGLSQAEIDQLVAEAYAVEDGTEEPDEGATLALLFPDPKPTGLGKSEHTLGSKYHVIIQNRGPRRIWTSFRTQITVIKIPPAFTTINCRPMLRFPDTQEAISGYVSGVKLKKYWTIAHVDCFDQIFEGAGELNNWMVRRI